MLLGKDRLGEIFRVINFFILTLATFLTNSWFSAQATFFYFHCQQI